MANVEVSAAALPTRSGSVSGLFWTLRTMVTLQMVAILGQAIFAGMLLEGTARALHGVGSLGVHVFGLLQLILAILVWRPGRGSARYIVPSTFLLLAGFVQSAAGGSEFRYLHVPLGAAMLAGAVVMVTQVWSRPKP
jgi:hypothetical protein